MQYILSNPAIPLTIVTLEEAKANLRITHDLQDEMIQGMINTAVQMAENYTGRAIRVREVKAVSSVFQDQVLLEHTPILGDVAITYYDESDTETTLDPALYSVTQNSSGEPVISYSNVDALPKLFTRTDAVIISYEIGYDSSTVPAPYKTYILLMVTKLYENPGDTALKYRSFANSILFAYKNHS